MEYAIDILDMDNCIVDDINRLLSLLPSSERQVCEADIEKLLNYSDTTVVIATTTAGQIIGMGTICPLYVLGATECVIHDVVVLKDYRGQGVAQRIMEQLIEVGFDFHEARQIDLTSSSGRAAANHLYQKLGFERYDTNVYRLKASITL